MKPGISALLNNRKLFLLSILSLVFAGILSLLLPGKSTAFIPLYANHPFWLNVFFVNYTFMGDGVFAICLIAVFIFYLKRKQQGIALLVGFLLSEFIVQLLKNIDSFTGPTFFFEPGQYLFITDTISVADHSSLVSGHTATAFAIVTVLILVVKNSNWQLPLLATALLLGYSRIYLAQHHLPEIMIGAIVGTVSGITAVYVAYYFKWDGHYFKKFQRFKRLSLTS